jgi:small subunit ribosomal protein S6
VKSYELAMIFSPKAIQEEIDEAIRKIDTSLNEEGARVRKIDRWGRRELAYPIKKFNQGYFVLIYLEAEKEIFSKINTLCKPQEIILRTLLVREAETLESIQGGKKE